MRPLRLELRILLTLLVPLATFAPITLGIVYRTLDATIATHADARGLAVAQQISAVIVDKVLTGEAYAAERDMADIVRAHPDVAYAFAVDSKGEVFAHTFSGGFPTDLIQVHRSVRPNGSVLTLSMGGRVAHDLAAPILGGVAGWVHVGVATRSAQDSSSEMLLYLSLVGVGVVLVGLALAYGLSSQLSRRLGRVATVAVSIGAGDLDARVGDPADDEIGRLASAFDRMVARRQQARHEWEHALQRLADSQKLAAVGRLAAGVAHEINNPLTGLQQCVEALEAGDRDEAKRRQYYRLMADGASRAQRVVKELLEYARPHPLEILPVNLGHVARHVANLLRPAIERAGVRCNVSVDAALPEILADRHGIEQVLTNLVLNALDATPEGGEISIAVDQVGREARLRVEDTGTGIASDALTQLFEPFFTTKGGARGTGLGLSVSLGIVERHGGRIEVRSEPGRGSTFDVVLPIAGDAAGARREEAAE